MVCNPVAGSAAGLVNNDRTSFLSSIYESSADEKGPVRITDRLADKSDNMSKVPKLIACGAVVVAMRPC